MANKLKTSQRRRINQRQKERYHQNKHIKQTQIDQSTPNIKIDLTNEKNLKQNNRDINYLKNKNDLSVQKYFDEINEICENECSICLRLFYSDGIKNISINQKIIDILKSLKQETKGTKYPVLFKPSQLVPMCHTCSKSIKTNKMPKQSIYNSMFPGEIPYQLQLLTDIELALISNLNSFLK